LVDLLNVIRYSVYSVYTGRIMFFAVKISSSAWMFSVCT